MVMEAVLKWQESVLGVSDASFHRFLRVCLFLVLAGVLCLCMRRCMQTGSKQEAGGKDFPVREIGMVNVSGLSDVRCDAGDRIGNLLKEGMERKGSIGACVMPAPAEAVKTVSVKGSPGRTAAVERTDIEEISRPVLDFMPDIPQDLPSGIEMPGMSDDRSEGKPAEHPEQDLPAVSDPAVKEETPGADGNTGIRESAGFLIDEEGYITGYTSSLVLVDGILIPATDEGCIGIRKDAFSGLGSDVMEVFIPVNITDIEPGAFDTFTYLAYIEAAADNPVYYSKDGILYTYSEDVVCMTGR